MKRNDQTVKLVDQINFTVIMNVYVGYGDANVKFLEKQLTTAKTRTCLLMAKT